MLAPDHRPPCPVCGAPAPSPLTATQKRTAFAIGVIAINVPMLFLLTRPGDAHPNLAFRLAICVVGGIAAMVVAHQQRRLALPRCCRRRLGDPNL